MIEFLTFLAHWIPNFLICYALLTLVDTRKEMRERLRILELLIVDLGRREEE